MITDANLLRAAISANLGKDGDRQFKAQIKTLNITVQPYEDPEG